MQNKHRKRSIRSKRKRLHSLHQRASGSSGIKSISILYDTLLLPGIIYRKLDVELADSEHALVYAVTCVVRNPRYSIELVQACDQLGKLETLPAMVQRLDSNQNKEIYAAINASYWRAYYLTPRGICVSNGEVVFNESLPWFSFWMDKRHRAWLDSQRLQVSIQWKESSPFSVHSTNTFISDTAVTLYNRFAGDSISSDLKHDTTMLHPSNQTHTISKHDSTSAHNTRAYSIYHTESTCQELHRPKLILRYLRTPVINATVPCLVLKKIDSGKVEIPLRGCVITFPSDHQILSSVQAGDTIVLRASTVQRDSVEHLFAVSGTPVLVRNNHIPEQLTDTTIRASRFVAQRVARTAIGTDIIQSVLYLVVVEGGTAQSRGMTLRELAQFMKRFGAYNALNLDGGSSTCMVIGDRCVVPSTLKHLRPVVNAIVISRRKTSIPR